MSATTVPNPSGVCQCGCGEPTPIARYHRKADGILKGQHVRYIKGHWSRTQQKPITPPNPSGLCLCGCGDQTPLATRNRADKGIVKGEPLRYIPGHDKRGLTRPLPDDQGPNPSGLCLCGCGQKTSIAPASDPQRFKIRGRPMRYLKGHERRGKSHPPTGKKLAQIEAAQEVHRRVVADYLQGLPLDEIATRHGYREASAVGWIVARARADGQHIERRHVSHRIRLDRPTLKRFEAMWKAGATASAIRAEFGWDRAGYQSALARARKYGFASRSLRPEEMTASERRALKRAAAKIKMTEAEVSDAQRTLLRVISASDKPISSVALVEVLHLLRHPRANTGWVVGTLRRMQANGLVAKVPVEQIHRHGPRFLWFVPLDREQPAAALTLTDAKRETELAALIREQEEELDRGQWARVDFKTISLDAQFGEDGGSFHDLLVAGDEPFRAGVVDR